MHAQSSRLQAQGHTYIYIMSTHVKYMHHVYIYYFRQYKNLSKLNVICLFAFIATDNYTHCNCALLLNIFQA